MADLLDFQIVRLPDGPVLTSPKWVLSGRIVDSQTQKTTKQDFRAVKVAFPDALASLSAADQDEFAQMVSSWLLQRLFPAAYVEPEPKKAGA